MMRQDLDYTFAAEPGGPGWRRAPQLAQQQHRPAPAPPRTARPAAHRPAPRRSPRIHVEHRPPPPVPSPLLMQEQRVWSHRHGELLSSEAKDEIECRASALQPPPDPDCNGSMVVLVEMNCQPEMRTIRHDLAQYERYFERLRDAIGTRIQSADGVFNIDVTVEMTSVVHSLPGVWMLNGRSIAMPPGTPSFSGTNASRVGAFEVYLVTDLPDITKVERVSILFSKLWTRRWPNIPKLAKRCQAALEPAFAQWSADKELRLRLGSVSEADDARRLHAEYRDAVSHELIVEMETKCSSLETADRALLAATECDVGVLRQAILEHRSNASPSVAFMAHSTLACKKADVALRSMPAEDPTDLAVAIEAHRDLASAEVVAETEARLRMLQADIALREGVAPLTEASAIREMITLYRSKSSAAALNDASGKLSPMEAADVALTAAMQEDIDSLKLSMLANMKQASRSVAAESEDKLIQLEADEALTTAIAEADATLESMPAEDPTAMAVIIETHRDLASAEVVADAEARLRMLQADIALREGVAPLTEASAIREMITLYRSKSSAAALNDASEKLSPMEAADVALAAAMQEDTDSLRSAIDDQQQTASTSVVEGANAKLIERVADDALRVARTEVDAESIKGILEVHRADASSTAVDLTVTRISVLEHNDAALRAAMAGESIEMLQRTLVSCQDSANPPVVADAKVRLAKLEADEAMRRARKEADQAIRASPAELAILNTSIEANRALASRAVVAEAETLRTLLLALTRELEGDSALHDLMASKSFDEADAVRAVLEEHGDYAAPALVNSATAKLYTLDVADAALHDVVTRLQLMSTPGVDVDTVDSDTREQEASAALFQALVDHGPLSSRSVRMAAWRLGGSDLCMQPTLLVEAAQVKREDAEWDMNFTVERKHSPQKQQQSDEPLSRSAFTAEMANGLMTL